MTKELMKMVHAMILDSPVPAKTIAKDIGKPYSTLLREINPYDSGAKLGVETFIHLIKATGNTAPLEYIARHLGMKLVESDSHRAKAS